MFIDGSQYRVEVDEGSQIVLGMVAERHGLDSQTYVRESIIWGVGLLEAGDIQTGPSPIYIVFLGEEDTAVMYELPLGEQNSGSITPRDVPEEFAAFEADIKKGRNHKALPTNPDLVTLTKIEADERGLDPGHLLNAFITLYDSWLAAVRQREPVFLRDATGEYSELYYR